MPRRTADALNRTSSAIIAAAIEIHRALGPGLLESAYLTCLIHELVAAQLRIEKQKALVVEESVLIEVKALETLAPIHSQQLYTYLRLGHYPVGLLLNFGAPTMKAGIKRIVNGFPEK